MKSFPNWSKASTPWPKNAKAKSPCGPTRSISTTWPPLSAEEVVAVRQQLNLSRSVFAMYLRTNIRTLENWEQGRAKPNAQATTLIRLVARFPETVAQLAALG